jgi:hypothetical protein
VADGVVVHSVLQLEPAPVVRRAVAAGDLSEEDCRLCGLALAEEDRVVAHRRRRCPVDEELSRVRRDAVPVARPPDLNVAAYLVDERVLLAPLSGVEVHRQLGPLAALGRRGNRDERLARTPTRQHQPRRSVRADLEVRRWCLVRRVDDWVGEVRRVQPPLLSRRSTCEGSRWAKLHSVQLSRRRFRASRRSRSASWTSGPPLSPRRQVDAASGELSDRPWVAVHPSTAGSASPGRVPGRPRAAHRCQQRVTGR